MGIVRTVEWRLATTPVQAHARLYAALEQLGMNPVNAGDRITAAAPRALRRNRWAAQLEIDLQPVGDHETIAACRVDMPGNKHEDVLDEIAAAVGDDAFDDRGVTEPLEGTQRLRHVLRGDERVLALSRGVVGTRRALVVLTDQRIFGLERRAGSVPLQELTGITKLEANGDTLVVHANGTTTEFKEAGEIARTQGDTPDDDPISRLERLAALHERGALTDDEFARLKRDLID